MFEDSEDKVEELISPAELGMRLGAGPALIRYAIDAGCPTQNGKISQGMFVLWMTDHYNDFRKLVGLPLLPPHEAEAPSNAAHAQVGNMLLTLTDYINSRASTPETKAAAADAGNFIRGRL